MNLNDVLVGKGIDPVHVLVMRHRPPHGESPISKGISGNRPKDCAIGMIDA